jgi:hypothetical protein
MLFQLKDNPELLFAKATQISRSGIWITHICMGNSRGRSKAWVEISRLKHWVYNWESFPLPNLTMGGKISTDNNRVKYEFY